MRMSQVRDGHVYAVRISGSLRPVRVRKDDRENLSGLNLISNRKIRIKSARRLQFELEPTGRENNTGKPIFRRKKTQTL